MLDLLIYKIGFAALLISVVRRPAMLAAFLLCLSFIINQYVFVIKPTWDEFEQWATYISIKDAVIMLILLSRLKTPEFILGLSFTVSSLFHQIMLIQIENHILTLKHLRTDFMVIITVIQLATVIYILINGSATNGGKRVKYRIPILNAPVFNLFYTQTYKVKK